MTASSSGQKRTRAKVNGWVILDKPLHSPSTKAVNIIRRAFNAAKAGHSGTLNLASGICRRWGKPQKPFPMLWMPRKITRLR